jgi:D,D-heptose 1,7-bisphosphate phosphatase
MYGDTMLNIDLDRLWNAHQAEDDATIVVHPNDHPHDSDLVEADETGRVVAFHPYPHPAGHYFANLVNAALYVVNRNSLKEFTVRKPLDFGKHVFPELLASGGHIRAYRTREYIKDCGTPERVAKVERDYDSGRINRSSLRNALPAIFLDRDGTLNRENGYVTSPDQLHILAGAAEAVRLINGSGRLAVVITNQPVIARGDCTEAQLRLVHNKLEWILGEQHAYLDGIYFCPHHPEAGFEGERSELKIACDCRKPGTALLSGAVADLNIDVRQSWMIGDRAGDVQAAAAFGIRSAWVKSGAHTEVPEGCEPDCVFDNVLDAVTEILATP